MPQIGTWVFDEACRQAHCWINESELDLRIAINVSVHQIMQSHFVPSIFKTLDEYQLQASAIEIEVTESVVMADAQWIASSLLELQQAGIRIALDDFGTGYSSLSQLQELPLDTLKIDKSFISKLENETAVSQSFTETISKIAEILELETVAEGVETLRQKTKVESIGIDYIQGYLYSRPVPAADVPDTIASIDHPDDQLDQAA